MQITKDKLQERKSALEKERLQAIATVNAIDGALLDIEFWLAESAKDEGNAPEAAE